MPRFAPLVLALTVALLTGCKSDAEKQMANMTAKQKEVVTILKTVTDPESAKAANEKIKAVAKDIEGILESAKGTQTTDAERKRLGEKFKPEQQQITKDAQAELQRIAKLPGASVELMDGLMQLSTAGLRAGVTAPK